MSMAIGMINSGCGSSCIQHNNCLKKDGRRSEKKKQRASFIVSSSLGDQYKTLRIQPGATETDVKKAFRKLALQYHPDVCKGNNCGIQFNQINEAYNILLSNLRGEIPNTYTEPSSYSSSYATSNNKEVVYEEEEEEDYWEEWMGWEGAGIRDYSSHINPYIYHE